MKDFLEKRIFNLNWLFAIIVISFHIETIYHPNDVSTFLSKFISNTNPIEIINRVLTGIGVGLLLWFVIKKLIHMKNGRDDFFIIHETLIIFDTFIWTILFKYAIAIILSSLNDISIINSLTAGWHAFYIPLLLLALLSLIIGLHLENQK